jgi:hypothetical protein
MSAFADFGLDSLSGPAVKPLAAASQSTPSTDSPPGVVAGVALDSIDSLSVKELRAHLTRLRVDTSGCVEKQEFQVCVCACVSACVRECVGVWVLSA